MKLVNAFSINMLTGNSVVRFTQITIEQAKEILSGNLESFIGHTDTANVLSSLLGIPIAVNRASFTVKDKENFIVAQLTGQRLPEGTTSLPEGAVLTFWLVEVSRD
jgi:cytochrome b